MFFLFFIACRSTIVENVEKTLTSDVSFSVTETDFLSESLFDAERSVSMTPSEQFYSSSGLIYRNQEWGEAQEVMPGTELCAAKLLEHNFLCVDGIVYFEDEEGAWIESSFNSSLGYATEYMYTNADSVFFGGSGRLFRWSDEHLSQISIGDHFLYDSIVFGDDLFLRTPQLFRYNLSTKEATLIEEEAVRDMSVDGAGGMWFAIESLLHWMDLDGRRLFYDLSFPILDIESDAEGSGIWVRTEEKVLFIRDSQFWEVSLPEGVWHDVDSFDRLLVESEGVVHRFSIDRPVSIYGLEPMEAIATRRVLTLLPSHPSDITDVQVFVSGIELEVNEDTWVFSLDPEDLDTGLHQLNILTHTEMDSSLFVVPFVNEELMDVSWEEDIQPLYEEKCSECHAGASATVLVEKEDWERKIDSIIDAVSREVMPINAEPLSTEEITTIRAWKQGGFQ